MKAPTHYAFSCLVCTAAGLPPVMALPSSLISLLPDIDHPESLIGRVFPSLSKKILSKWGHRTVTHSVFAILAVSVIFLPLIMINLSPLSPAGAGQSLIPLPITGEGQGEGLTSLYFALLLSFSSHIFLDLFNRAGVKLLSPFSVKEYISFHNPTIRIRTGSWQEVIICVIFVFGVFLISGEKISLNKAVRTTAKIFYRHYDGALADYEHASKNICTVKIDYFDPVESKEKKERCIILTMFPENVYLLKYSGSDKEIHSTQLNADSRLILKKDIINEIEITDTGIPRKQTRIAGNSLHDLEKLPSDSVVSGTIILKNYQPVLRNSDYIRVSHSPTATTVTLVCALSGELGEILALERMRSAELESLKSKQSSYQISRLTVEQGSLESKVKALTQKGFYANYSTIIRINSEIKKIESRIDALRMQEASGADADIAAKIEMMENAYGVDYEVWVTRL